ncbi:hypothetical protein [Burkholderia ubonensis]|uniref:hypothetical protein n=1 Tax=Burkholderia ubonensis TaxID=101571 RepID=UPI000A4651C4|nr:hypothetical protein [Burkholderia ubonensis]
MALEPLPVASITRYFDATASAAVKRGRQYRAAGAAAIRRRHANHVIRHQISNSRFQAGSNPEIRNFPG